MRRTRSRCLATFVVAVAACGGGSHSSTPDAAADTLTGLGQTCVVGMGATDCPATAPGCVRFSTTATTGICSQKCAQAETVTTDAQGAIPVTAAQLAVCSGVFSGSVGTPACNAVVVATPADNPLKPNTKYLVDIACTITCGTGNVCPGSLTCNTSAGTCEP